MASNVINIREFVDVTTSVAATPTDVSRNWGAVLFVQKGSDGASTTIATYESLDEIPGSNTEGKKFAEKFYGTTYEGVAPTAPITIAVIGMANTEEFSQNFTALLSNEAYYYIGLDSNCSDDIKKAAASINQANQSSATHVLVLDDNSESVFNTTLEEDVAQAETMSVAAYCATNKFTKTMVIASNPSNTNKYYSASAIAFYSTRRFDTSALRLASIAHKPCSGAMPIDFSDSSIIVTADAAWKNLDSKNATAYINVKLVGLSAWERGNCSEGGDVVDYIAADYLNYTVSIAVFQLLQSVPRLPMNQSGASMLANVLDGAFNDLRNAGLISGGTSLDGEVFSASGYHYSIPTPTGVKKANGLWDGIYCTALLSGSCKKVVIGNELKK